MLGILRAGIFVSRHPVKGEDPADAENTFPPAHPDAHVVLKGRTCEKWISTL